MTSLSYLFVMTKSTAINVSRNGSNGVKPLVVKALVLISVSTVLATVSAEFRFYKTNQNGAKNRVLYENSLVINCTTNDPSANTKLILNQLSGSKITWDKSTPSDSNIERVGDVFTVKRFGKDYAGLFECHSTNKNKVTITWNDPSSPVYPAEPHYPKATISTSYQSLDMGDNFNLSCTSRNYNKVKWFKITQENKYSMISSDRITTTTTATDDIVTIMIKDAKISDSGKYVCVATYDDKNDTKKATIKVLEPTPPVLVDYSGKKTSVVVRSPSNIRIYCTFQGYPLPTIKWYKSSKEIQGCVTTTYPQCRNSRIILENKYNERQGVLTISKATYNDRGTYICKATNKKGNSHVAISVKVETGARILVDPENQNIITNLGKSINMTCRAEGYPTPSVSWTDSRGKELKHGMGTVILSLSAVTKDDMGNYTCNATNFKSDFRLFTVRELVSMTNNPGPMKQKGLKPEYLVTIAVCVCIIFFLFIAICLVLYRRQKMVTDKYILGSEITDYQIDPDRSLLEQCRNLPYDLDWEFPEKRLILGETLGSGAFGLVLKAEAIGIQSLQPRDKSPKAAQLRARLRRTSVNKEEKRGRRDSTTCTKQIVAVKTLKEGATKNDYTDLASELKILIHIGEHKNIINILGACTRGRRLMVITEFAPHGNLLTFLRERRDIYEPNWVKTSDNPDQELTLVDLGKMAYSISRGMEFLTLKKCVHRDLAARNILVGKDYVIKVSDFGLARDIYQEDLYVKTSKGLLPIKWMALESLFDRVYTHMSDVWAFGIVLWEIFTLGGTPYPTVPIEQLMDFLTQGQRMLQPNCCPDEMYDLMRQCWNHCPEDRPAFVDISYKLGQIFQNNVSEDTLGYLLLNKKTPLSSNCCSELETVESNLTACREIAVDAAQSTPDTKASSKEPPPSSKTNNNEYISGTLKKEKMIEHKPLLNQESTV